MDLSNIVIYAIVAIVLLFVLPKLGIGVGRGRGNSPLNPPGNRPGGGGGLFPTAPDQPDEPDRPAPRDDAPRTSGDFADRVEGRGPEKKT
jgi:hypothetical protein